MNEQVGRGKGRQFLRKKHDEVKRLVREREMNLMPEAGVRREEAAKE